MLCDDCKKNEAFVHITQIGPNGKMDKNLCGDCAAKYGSFPLPADPKNFSINAFLKGIFQRTPVDEEMEEAKGIVCPNCGMTYQDFAKNGELGCSVCYSTFRQQLAPFLSRALGTATHRGKVPRRAGGALVARQEISLLKDRLADAVESEEYEKAAVLRDRIRDIEKKLASEKKEGAR